MPVQIMLQYAVMFLFFQVVAANDPIRCINYYGIETEREAPVCSWKHEPSWYLSSLKEMLKLNTIRVPFSYQYIKNGKFTELDSIVETASSLNLSIILDWHRNTNSNQSASPETDLTVTEWIDSWTHILRRYSEKEFVIGLGAYNELQTGDPDYAVSLQTQLVSKIEEVFPGRFQYFLGCPSWGSNCSGVSFSHMSTWNRTFVDIHTYPFSKNSTEASWNKTIPSSIESNHWFVGESGWFAKYETEKWAKQFLGYLKNRNITNLCFWTIALSQDTGGIWKDDCETLEYSKIYLLQEYWDITNFYDFP